jgi:hypothetical protein
METLNIKSTLRQGLLAGAAIIGLMAVTPDANASSYALSQLTVSNMLLSGGPTFSTFLFSSSTNAAVTGIGAGSSTPGAVTTAYSFATDASCHSAAPGGCVDPAVQFISNGLVSPGENAFTAQNKQPGQFSPSFAYSDAVVRDTKINANPSSTIPGGNFKQIAEASVNGTDATAQAGQTTQTWRFSASLTSGQVLTLDLDAVLAFIADATDLNALSARAVSDLSMTLQRVGGGSTQTVHFADLDQDVTAFQGDPLSDFGGTFNGLSESLTAGLDGTYNIIIESLSKVDVVATAPEPATLSLMGLGLLGLGYASRRRRKTA